MTIDVSHHDRSLVALAGDGDGSLREALGWLLPARVAGLDLELMDCAFDEEGWWSPASPITWFRRAFLSLGSGDLVADIELRIPWNCDEDARTHPLPGATLGAHDALYVGRPLVPLTQLVRRPGIHVLPTTKGEDPARLLLVPDVGPTLSMETRRRGVSVRVGASKPVSVEWKTGPGGDLVVEAIGSLSRPAARTLHRALHLLAEDGLPAALFSVSTRNAIVGKVGEDALGSSAKLIARLSEVLTTAGSPQILDDLSDEALHYRLYGDLVRRQVVEAFRKAMHRFDRNLRRAPEVELSIERRLRMLATSLESRASRAIDQLVTGRTSGAAVVVLDDDANTLASLEKRRQITRFGPSGLHSPLRGTPWQRGIHPDRHGEICPLQTRESEDLGLIRYLATSATIDGDHANRGSSDAGIGWDLSAAAALIPFINHNDPTRSSIGAKNLKQVTPIMGAQPPRVRTGAEPLVAEHGVRRSSATGRVRMIDPGCVVVDQTPQPFGPPILTTSIPQRAWRALVASDDIVDVGEIVAAASDVVVEDGIPTLAMGRDILAAYTPWHGWNYEDGIVVSEAIVDAFTSEHTVRFTEPVSLRRGEWAELLVEPGDTVETHALLARVLDRDGLTRREIRAPEAGKLTTIDQLGIEIAVELSVKRRLAVGDKLTNRHGGKGVVAKILPAAEMPRLVDGTPVEMILNPLSVIRRLNIGQLLETHVSLLMHLTGERSRVVGRRLDDLTQLRDQLAALGAPGGRLPLITSDGTAIGAEPVVVGWQHFVKLNHLAVAKARSRASGDRSVRDQQAAKGTTWHAGRKVGGAQRAGEMELWALQAIGADRVLADALARSGEHGQTYIAVLTHLRAAGIQVEHDDGATRYRLVEDDPTLEPLPAELVSAVADRRTFREVDRDQETAPLHNEDLHGGYTAREACSCGAATIAGTVCDVCDTPVHRHPGAERRTMRYKVDLAVAVPHPWYRDVPADEAVPMLASVPVLPPAYRSRHHDPLDRAYLRLIAVNEAVRAGRASGADAVAQLSSAVGAVLGTLNDQTTDQTIAARLSGKSGLLRRSLRGRNDDWTGRAVIVPNPDRDPETVGVPGPIYDRFQIGDKKIAEHDDVVILNRQPSLHPYNLVALRAERITGTAIELHPILCKAIAGDFDGDEVTIHRPASPTARRQAFTLLRPAATLRSAADGTVLAKLELDVALGLWLLGRDTHGRDQLDALGLPSGTWTAINAPSGPIASAQQAALAETLVATATDARDALERLTRLWSMAVARATGWSFSCVELEPDTVFADSALDQAIQAGVAGGSGGIDQLLRARGPLADFGDTAGRHRATPDVASSFLVGLTDQQLFDTTPGALRALSDKKLVTPQCGDLTKRLVELAYDVTIAAEDCGSNEPRRPFTCRCPLPHICRRCYGPTPDGSEPPELGRSVGLLAAMLVGERSTQSAMKTFQSGGTNVAVGGRIPVMRAAFGYGVMPEPIDARLVDCVDFTEAGNLDVERLDPVVELLAALLDHKIALVHLEVLLRRLAQVATTGASGNGESLLTAAQHVGDPLIDATNRGSLRVIADAARQQLRVAVPATSKRQVICVSEASA